MDLPKDINALAEPLDNTLSSLSSSTTNCSMSIREQTRQMSMIIPNLEELVAEDHDYRKLLTKTKTAGSLLCVCPLKEFLPIKARVCVIADE